MSGDRGGQGGGAPPLDPWTGRPAGSRPPRGQQPGPWAPPPPGWTPPPPGWTPPPPGWTPPPPGWTPSRPHPPATYPSNGDPVAPGPIGAPGSWAPQPIPDPYPVNVSFPRRTRISRFWGIPLLGHLVRVLVLIPHAIVLPFVALGVAILSLFTWIPVLVSGRFPRVGYRWVGGILRWSTRISAWVLLLTSAYPPLSLESDEHPVRVRIDKGGRIGRLWGIPVLGVLVRWVLLLPHWVALFAVALLASLLTVFSWIPVLLYGRQADLVYALVGGYLRWSARVLAYQALMASRYPPFSLGEDDPAPVW
jgi:hypothetical protein